MKEVGLELKKNTAETLTLAVKKKRNELIDALTMQGHRERTEAILKLSRCSPLGFATKHA